MATSGTLNPNVDTYVDWAVSPGGPIWSALADGNGSTYVYTGAQRTCEVGLEDPAVSAGWEVAYVYLGVAWTSDGGVTAHVELWLDGVGLASGASAISYTFPTPISAATASRLRLRLVSDYVPGGSYARAIAASGSWTGSDTVAPAAPTGLVGTPGWQTAGLSWNANGDPDLVGYKLYRKIGAGAYDATPIYTGSTPNYSDTGLTNGTVYTYKVTAYDTSANESVASAEASVTPTPPPVPTSLVADVGVELLRLSWTSPSVAGYKLYRKIGTGAYDSTPIYTGTATSYSDTGLTPGTTYTYKVTSYDSGGHESSASAETSGVPTANRATDTYSGGDLTIAPSSSSRWIQLADPLQRAQLHRIIPSFHWTGDNCPLQIAVTQNDGSYVIPWTTLAAPTTEGDIHRPVIECFAETEAIQIHFRVPPDSTVPFVKLEVYDTLVEYQEARQRQS